MFAHAQTAFVNRDVIDYGIWPGEIYMLKNTRHQARISRASVLVDLSIVADENGFARGDICNSVKTQDI